MVLHAQFLSLLQVHQEDWQRDLLAKYGSSICMLDATYKTTKYDLALYFVAVRTNVGYSIVAEFVVQSERACYLAEALDMLRKWNPSWCPQYWMTDYSEAEQLALQKVFPSCTVYLCDFHREQAWGRWIRSRQSGLSTAEQEELLSDLRSLAWASPGSTDDKQEKDHFYRIREGILRKSRAYHDHDNVQEWLDGKWLSCPEVWLYSSMFLAITTLACLICCPSNSYYLMLGMFFAWKIASSCFSSMYVCAFLLACSYSGGLEHFVMIHTTAVLIQTTDWKLRTGC